MEAPYPKPTCPLLPLRGKRSGVMETITSSHQRKDGVLQALAWEMLLNLCRGIGLYPGNRKKLTKRLVTTRAKACDTLSDSVLDFRLHKIVQQQNSELPLCAALASVHRCGICHSVGQSILVHVSETRDGCFPLHALLTSVDNCTKTDGIWV